MNKQLTPDDLRRFTGTEKWTRHALNRNMLYTDGVKYFAEEAGAYWFLDIMATEIMDIAKREPFIHVVLHVPEGSSYARITADDGNGNELWRRDVEFTDCPGGEWNFYLTDNVLLLPSEY